MKRIENKVRKIRKIQEPLVPNVANTKGKTRWTRSIVAHDRTINDNYNIFEVLEIEEVTLPLFPEEFAVDIIDFNDTIMKENEKLENQLIGESQIDIQGDVLLEDINIRIDVFCSEIDKIVKGWNSLSVEELNKRLTDFESRELKDSMLAEELEAKKLEEYKKKESEYEELIKRRKKEKMERQIRRERSYEIDDHLIDIALRGSTVGVSDSNYEYKKMKLNEENMRIKRMNDDELAEHFKTIRENDDVILRDKYKKSISHKSQEDIEKLMVIYDKSHILDDEMIDF